MKTIDDNEIIETSRGKKRIGPIFDENAMLHAENARLREALADIRSFTTGYGDVAGIVCKMAAKALAGGAK